MGFPQSTISFPDLTLFNTDDVRLTLFIPLFFTVQNQDGGNQWVNNATKILGDLYFAARNKTAVFEFVPASETTGNLKITPQDKAQYEMVYNITKGLSEFDNP